MSSNLFRRARIIGTGSYVPEKRLTNADLEKIVETSSEWIIQRTGIKERRQARPDQATSDLGHEAAKLAIADAGLTPADIDMIIFATVTADTVFPATACRIQDSLGCRLIPAFDLAAACSGFIYALDMARMVIACGSAKHILVVGAECLTRITDYEDRGTCILFGDGAGAVVLAATDDPDQGIIDTFLAADGSGGDMMILPGGGSRRPATPEMLAERLQYIKLQGRSVYKHAISKIVRMVNESLNRHKLSMDDVKLIIPHQMNARIIESAAKHLKIPLEKIYVNIDRFGNTSSATIPIAIDEVRREGRIKKGDLISLVAFGGGMTWASALLRW